LRSFEPEASIGFFGLVLLLYFVRVAVDHGTRSQRLSPRFIFDPAGDVTMATTDNSTWKDWWRSPVAVGGVITFVFTATLGIFQYFNSVNQTKTEAEKAFQESRKLRDESAAIRQQSGYRSQIEDQINLLNAKIDEREVEINMHEEVQDTDQPRVQRRITQLKSEIAALEKRRDALEEKLLK
jgi:hypothetical protein